MAFVIRHGLWRARQQPPVAVEIDWTHPLALGLVSCFLARPGGGMIDLTGRTRVVSGTTQPVRASGLTFDTWSVTNASTTDLDFTSGGWAVGAFGHLGAISITAGQNPTVFGRFVYTSEISNSGWAVGLQGGSGTWLSFCFANNDFNSYQLLGTTTPTAACDVFLGLTSNATTRRFVVNGVQEATSALNPNPVTSTGNLTQTVPSSGFFDGSYLLLAWRRDVSLAEWAWLNSEPYCFLRPRQSASFRGIPATVAWPAATVSF